MNRRRWALVVIGAVVIGLFQATLISVLPSPWRELQPVLPLSVLFVVLNRPKAAVVFAGIAGFIIHLFSVDTVPFAFIWMMLAIAIIAGLSRSVLTNRSMYATAALVFGARMIVQLCAFLSSFLGSFMFKVSYSAPSFSRLWIVVLWDIVFASIGFLAVAIFTRRFLVTLNRAYTYDES